MAFNQQVTPHLQIGVPIVDDKGHPTPQFLQFFQQLLNNTGNLADGAVPSSRQILTKYGVSGGGDLTADLTISTLTPVTTQAGTTYTADLDDSESWIEFTNGSAVTFTIPPNSSVAYPVGTTIALRQAGTGQITVAPGSGVTINVAPSLAKKTFGQYSVAQLIKVGTDSWALYGDLASA